MQKKNGFAILALNANFHDVSEEWVNIAELESSEIYPDANMYIHSVPVSAGGVFQIMINAGSKYIQGRYSGDADVSVVQDILIWLTQ